MATKKRTKFDFESSLKRLELIIDKIEQGKLDLEESLKLFGEGVELTKKCQQALKVAEQKVQILIGDKLENFECGSDEDLEDE